MIIIIMTSLSVLGSLGFLYFFWKKLKDDYSQHQIFSTGFYALIGLTVGYVFSQYYFQSFWFWTSGIGSLIGLYLGVKHFKMRFLESLEGWIIGSLFALFVSSWFLLYQGFMFPTIINAFAILALILVFFYINKRYKRYVWYRSGKVGFTGLTVAGFYFVFRASYVLFSGIMNKSNVWEAIVSATFAFACFIALYNLSKKEI